MTEDTLQQLAEKVQECFTNAPASVDLNGTTVTYREEIVKCALEVAYALGRKQGLEEAAKIAVPPDVIKGTSSYIEGYREGQSYIVTEIRKLIESRKEE